MKKTMLILVFFTLNTAAYADNWSAAREYFANRSQDDSGSSFEGSARGGSQSVVQTACDESEQTSLPMELMHAIGFNDIDVNFNEVDSRVNLRSNSIITNCKSMLEFKLESPGRDESNYYLSAQFYNNGCSSAGEKCTYQVQRKVDGVFTTVEAQYEPNYLGFKKCLSDAGIIEEDESENISFHPEMAQTSPFSQSFANLGKSGTFYWKSHGPLFDADQSHGWIEELSTGRCTYVEQLRENPVVYYTASDRALKSLHEEAVEKCNQRDYLWLRGNLPEFREMEGGLADIRNQILNDRVQEALEDFRENGELDSEGLTLINDFFNYVIQPKMDEIDQAYQAYNNADSASEKRRLKEIYERKIRELAEYRKKPFFNNKVKEAMEEKGYFEEALASYRIRSHILAQEDIGRTINSTKITPSRAIGRANARVRRYADSQVEMKREWEARTGEYLGRADEYANESRYYSRRIESRTENYQAAIDALIQEMQDECQKYWKNTQRCMGEYVEYINALKEDLYQKNETDYEMAEQYADRANHYHELEAIGRARVADSRGESEEDDESGRSRSPSVSVNVPRPSFNFESSSRPQTSSQGTSPYQQNPFTQRQQFGYQSQQSPYGGGYQTQSFMSPWQGGGQAGFQMGGSYGLGHGMGAQRGAYGAMNPFFGQNPYSGYGQQQWGGQQQMYGNPYSQYYNNPAYSPMRSPAAPGYFGM